MSNGESGHNALIEMNKLMRLLKRIGRQADMIGLFRLDGKENT